MTRYGQGGRGRLRPRPPKELRTLLDQQVMAEEKLKERLEKVACVVEEERDKLRKRWRRNHLPPERAANGGPRLTTADETTRADYGKRGDGLLTRYRRQADKERSDGFDGPSFVNWLFSWKPFVAEATWRSYRAYARTLLQSRKSSRSSRAVDMLDGEPQIGRQTEHAGRLKHDHFEKLKEELAGEQGAAAAWLLDWLVAGIHTGLTPMEWRLATLAERGSELWLDVNAINPEGKLIVGRSLGVSRLPTETLDAVKRMVERGKQKVARGTWPTGQSEVTALLRDTSKALFPRMQLNYTLHSLRSQFIANVASVCKPDVAAALAGELCGDRDRLHYVNTNLTWSREQIVEIDIPRPVPQLLAEMKERLDWYKMWIDVGYRPLKTRAKGR